MPRRFVMLIVTAITLGVLTVQPVKAEEPSWTRVFDNLFITSVETAPFGILAGEFDTRMWTNPFNGVYISKDGGNSWKLLGLTEKGVKSIKYSSNNIYAATYYNTDTPPGLYRSSDKGETWELIGPPYSANYIEVIDNVLFLGTEAWGLYVSFDDGKNWENKINNIKIEHVRKIDNYIIASASNKTYKSLDIGKTWTLIPTNRQYPKTLFENYIYDGYFDDVYQNSKKTNLNLMVQDLTIVHTVPKFVMASVNGYGIYKYEIPHNELQTKPLLDIPWKYKSEEELLDTITAYFDHEYPLLGIGTENIENSNTTVNFFGIREKEPLLYYSSHNGTDYQLSYGENVLAAASGIAQYKWCNACGNTVEIDHGNGIKTIYMHLQDNTITKQLNNSHVLKGQIIGKVGMTGNTTGPHLHFTVKKDDNVIDPYGWQSLYTKDPWEDYKNNNINGTTSIFLWTQKLKQAIKIVNETESVINLDNKTVDFSNIKEPINYTGIIKNYIKPKNLANTLLYINKTSILIEAIDMVGNKIKNLPNSVKITYNLEGLDLSKVLLYTLKIYHFNEEVQQWEPLETVVDLENNLIVGYTNSFSQFALVGETNYSNKHNLDTALITNATFIVKK